MAADYLIARNHNIPIAVMSPKDFVKVLPSGFRRDQFGKLRHDPEKFNFFYDSTNLFSSACSKTLEVHTDEEFSTIKRRMTTLPIFFNVTLSEEHVNYGVFVKTRVTTRQQFMIFINPSHPVIKAQLLPLFEKVEKKQSEGGNYSLEISLDKLLRRWYQTFRNVSGYYKSRNATICVTNHSKRISACYSPVVWLALLPCMLVTGTLYVIGRSLVCTDEICELEAFVTLVKNRQPGLAIPMRVTRNERQSTRRNNVPHLNYCAVSCQPQTINAQHSLRTTNCDQFGNTSPSIEQQVENPINLSSLSTTNNPAAENNCSSAQAIQKNANDNDDDVSLISLSNAEENDDVLLGATGIANNQVIAVNDSVSSDDHKQDGRELLKNK